MKVLHLRDATGSDASVELHPQITVVRRLDPVHRAWLVDVLGRLAGGRDLPAAGEIEAHGIRFDLDDHALSLLGLDAPVQAVVTASDLPGHDPAAAATSQAREALARERKALSAALDAERSSLAVSVAERDDAVERLEALLRGEGAARDAMAATAAERSRLEFELQSAREERGRNEELLADAIEHREEAIEERSRLRTRLDAAQNRRRVAIAAATQAAAAAEASRSAADRSDDPAALADLAAERLDAAERAAAEADPDNADSPLNRRLADLERRRVELARLQVAIGDGSSESVAEALDMLLAASTDAPPMVAALALADSWRDLHQQISALEAGVSPAEREAEKRVSAARQAVIEAEADFNQPVLTPEQISKVEAAHAAVLETQDRAEGRFGGSRAERRLEELRSDERRVLERLGFSTYADYMMSSSSRGIGLANRAILDTARANLEASEHLLVVLPGAGERARRRIELLQRRDAIAPRVAHLLGHEATGPETEDELRALREPVAADQPALEELVDRLTVAGVQVGPAPYDRDDVVILARAYVAEERSAEVERNDVVKAIAGLDAAIDDLRTARDRDETEVPDLAALPALAEPIELPVEVADEAAAQTLREARWAEVESARAARADAEAGLARHHAACSELETRERALAEATTAEAEAAEAVAVAEVALGADIDGRVSGAADRVAVAEAALARSRANEAEAVDRITAGHGLTGAEALVSEAEQVANQAEAAVAEAAGTEQAAAAALADAEAAYTRAVDAELAVQEAAASIDRSALVDDVEWRLLSRLAGVRSVGPGGSVPLVLDDPFAVLRDDEVVGVLDRLSHIAGAVQVIVVSDRDAVVSWAEALGSDRVGIHVAA